MELDSETRGLTLARSDGLAPTNTASRLWLVKISCDNKFNSTITLTVLHEKKRNQLLVMQQKTRQKRGNSFDKHEFVA